jgi:hypothetical protein
MTPNDKTPETRTTADRRVPADDPLRELAFVLRLTRKVKAEILAEWPAGKPTTPLHLVGAN